MTKILCDAFVKQRGAYQRLINVARGDFPKMKPIKTETIMVNGYPVLLLKFETNG